MTKPRTAPAVWNISAPRGLEFLIKRKCFQHEFEHADAARRQATDQVLITVRSNDHFPDHN